eukprot:3936760-Rhodomonas_salina.2
MSCRSCWGGGVELECSRCSCGARACACVGAALAAAVGAGGDVGRRLKGERRERGGARGAVGGARG